MPPCSRRGARHEVGRIMVLDVRPQERARHKRPTVEPKSLCKMREEIMANRVITPAEVQALSVERGSLTWKKPAKREKYGRSVKADRTFGGIVYDSKREMEYAQELDIQRCAGLIERIDRQVPYPITVKGKHICKVVADFKIVYRDKRVEVHEVKGFETPVWRLKRKLFAACYPDTVLRIIK